MHRPLSRLLATACVLSVAGFVSHANAEPQQTVMMTKDPYCGCCDAWADHMRAAGFNVLVKTDEAMESVKAKLGVSPELASCHTAVVDGYVIEGHVPASAVKKLLIERPQAQGLSVPGMPMGSPGMDAPGQTTEAYDVLQFHGKQAQRFDRYQRTNKL